MPKADDAEPPKKVKSPKTDLKAYDLKRRNSGVELVIVNGIGGALSNEEESADSEYDTFLKSLSRKERHELRAIENELKSLSNNFSTKPLKYRVLKSEMPKDAKLIAFGKLKNFSKMTPDDQEYFKMKEWFETLLKIPFGKHSEIPVSKYDRATDKFNYLSDARLRLDKTIHGLDSTKNSFMQVLAQWISNPASTSNAIGLEGPPGCGKTLSVLAFAQITGRPFHLIALGGCKDSSYLIGHDFTYLGSKSGHLLNALINSNCMNPILFFDELDKVSESNQGQEIIGLLIHLIDATQNKFVQDRYLSGINIDLSRVMFVFSYNDASKIDPILLDRISSIKLTGYNKKDKNSIALEHILPFTFRNIGLHPDLIKFNKECLNYIIDEYTNKEPGVRGLKRALECICKQINLIILMKANNSLLTFKFDDFPIFLDKSDIDILMAEERPKTEQLSYFI